MTATVLTTVGKGWIIDKYTDLATATGPGTATEQWIHWGTGGSSTGGTATAGDTTLKAAATEIRVAATVSQSAADTAQFVGTLTAGTAKTIEEVGLFTATAGGVLEIRANHGGVALATGDSIQYTIQLQQT